MAEPSLIAKPRMDYAPSFRAKEKGRGLGILLFVAVLFLVLVGLAYGGIYFYRQSAQETLDGLTRELAQLEEDLDSEVINEIARVDRGLRMARSLLAAHVYSSNLFSLLEDHTLVDVYYTDFGYAFEDDGIVVTGFADGFISLHQQLQEIRSIPLVTGVVLEDIQLKSDDKDKKRTGVGFTLRVTFNKNVFRFK